VQDVDGFVLLVQSVEVVLCAFTRVMSLRGSVGRTAEVTSLNRRDMFQSHHLVSLSVSPAQRGNGGAAGWLQDSGLGCNGSRLPLCWALVLCFAYTFVLVFILELEKSERRRDVIVE